VVRLAVAWKQVRLAVTWKQVRQAASWLMELQDNLTNI
jgi:hypothetical protein